MGSSRRSSSGSPTSAAQMARRFFHPPDRVATGCASSSKPALPISTPTRASASWSSRPRTATPCTRTEPTVAPAATTGSWATCPILSRFRDERVPEDGTSSPDRIFRSVDFPDPLGPTTPMWSPSKMPKESPSNKGAAPKAFETSWQERSSSGM